MTPSTGPKNSVRWKYDPGATPCGRRATTGRPGSSSSRCGSTSQRLARRRASVSACSSLPVGGLDDRAHLAVPGRRAGRRAATSTASTSWRAEPVRPARPSRRGSPATRPSTSGRRGRRRCDDVGDGEVEVGGRGDDDGVLAAASRRAAAGRRAAGGTAARSRSAPVRITRSTSGCATRRLPSVALGRGRRAASRSRGTPASQSASTQHGTASAGRGCGAA